MTDHKIHKPPKLARRIFNWYCNDLLREEIEGDLEERFWDHCDQYGLRRARVKYWLNVMKFFRWHTLRPRNSRSFTQNNITMFRNYFKIAFRNALKHRSYTFINLSGLAVGLTSFILIVLYVQHQLSFDQFHQNKERIFRVTNGIDAITPNIVGPLFKRSFDEEIEKSVRVIELSNRIVKVEGKSHNTDIYFADPDFFSLFSFELLRGDRTTVLSQPQSLVITRKAAVKYFGTEEVLGKTLSMGSKQYTVRGIAADIHANSSMRFEMIMPFGELSWAQRETWSNWSFYTFVQLSEGVNPMEMEQKLKNLVRSGLGSSPDEEDQTIHLLQSMTDIYLQKRFKLEYELGRVGDIRYVYIFSAVAALILLIACINYVNLATSRSIERAKEVGIRKVVGAYRTQLISQFMGESFLYVFVALIMSLCLSYWLLPYFNELAGEQLDNRMIYDSGFLFSLVGLGLGITVVAGLYPAVVLSLFKPVTVLKGKYAHSGSGNGLRKVLVVVQFAISAFLVVATLVVKKQLSYIQDKNIGFDKEHVLFFTTDRDLNSNYQAFKNELLTNPNIIGVSLASHVPVSIGSAHSIQTGESENDYELIYFMHADKDFMELIGMELLAGLSLEERAVSFHELDSVGKNPSYIINETTARLFDWTPEEAVGKQIKLSSYEGPVQGVVKDFHFKSMQQQIEPFVILYNPRQHYFGYVKVGGDQMPETLKFIESNLNRVAPNLPFDYQFVDSYFERMYRFESRLGNVFLTFSGIAIFIACLGMFGLISFIALNRAREMGIRKVLGASAKTIVILLSSDFLKLVAIALLIGLPAAYYFMSDWLNDYQYRVSVGIDVSLIAVSFAVLVTMITIGYQALKTATVNPAKVLRNE